MNNVDLMKSYVYIKYKDLNNHIKKAINPEMKKYFDQIDMFNASDYLVSYFYGYSIRFESFNNYSLHLHDYVFEDGEEMLFDELKTRLFCDAISLYKLDQKTHQIKLLVKGSFKNPTL